MEKYFLISAAFLIFMQSLFKSDFKSVDFLDEVCDGIRECLLRAVVIGGPHSQHKLVLQWVGPFVQGKKHMGV